MLRWTVFVLLKYGSFSELSAKNPAQTKSCAKVHLPPQIPVQINLIRPHHSHPLSHFLLNHVKMRPLSLGIKLNRKHKNNLFRFYKFLKCNIKCYYCRNKIK